MRKKIELEDIIGIVKTDEVTNSVELKKEITTNNNLDKIHQQVIALQMDIKQCQNDLDRIKELLK